MKSELSILLYEFPASLALEIGEKCVFVNFRITFQRSDGDTSTFNMNWCGNLLQLPFIWPQDLNPKFMIWLPIDTKSQSINLNWYR